MSLDVNILPGQGVPVYDFGAEITGNIPSNSSYIAAGVPVVMM
jgi:hypothetical protein